MGAADALVHATLNVSAAAEADGGYAFGSSVGGQWSLGGMPIGYVNPSGPPTLESMMPAYGALEGGRLLLIASDCP